MTPTPEEFDALAKRFEEYEPRPEDRIDPATYVALREAAGQPERVIAVAVADARTRGCSWHLIGSLLGLAPETARKRYDDQGADSGSRT